MLSPALIQELKQNVAFKLCKSFVTDQGDFFVVNLVGGCKQHIQKFLVVGAFGFFQCSLKRNIQIPLFFQFFF